MGTTQPRRGTTATLETLEGVAPGIAVQAQTSEDGCDVDWESRLAMPLQATGGFDQTEGASWPGTSEGSLGDLEEMGGGRPSWQISWCSRVTHSKCLAADDPKWEQYRHIFGYGDLPANFGF